VLVIAHRKELIDQAVEHYRKLGYRFGHERIDTWYENVSTDKKIWIATVQSLTHWKNKRVKRLAPEEFGLVICDEAHHSVAKSYMFVCDHFGITQKTFTGLFLGVTATPVRNDRKSLGVIFDQAVNVIDTFKAIEDGWLVGIKYLQAHSHISLDDVPTNASQEFNLAALGKRIDQDTRNSLIFKAWEEKASRKRTIAFCATVKHAVNVAATFQKHGVSADVIHGQLPLEQRARIIKDHRKGNITVLANCEILTEGYDDPDVECIIMARPTQSQPLYVQMIGRGLRLPSGVDNLNKAKASGQLDSTKKTRCIIIDVVDNCARHDMEVVTALSLFSDSMDAAKESTARDVPQRPPAPQNGHAPAPEVFNAVRPSIEEIDLFASRKRSLKPRNPVTTRPQQLTPGPLAQWGVNSWGERYKQQLHGRIVAYWRLVQGSPTIRFKRLKDSEYNVAIALCAPGSWSLSCNSAKGTSHIRTFKNVFDAFGCGEYFVAVENGEGEMPPQVPRSAAPLSIQQCLLRVCDPTVSEARTFVEAQRRITQHMKYGSFL
jgi:superfamily II DNA or RNA helicase